MKTLSEILFEELQKVRDIQHRVDLLSQKVDAAVDSLQRIAIAIQAVEWKEREQGTRPAATPSPVAAPPAPAAAASTPPRPATPPGRA